MGLVPTITVVNELCAQHDMHSYFIIAFIIAGTAIMNIDV